MTISMKVIRAQVVQALLVAVLSPPLPLAAVRGGEVPQGKRWRVTYVEGPIVVPHGKNKKKKVRPLAPGSSLKIRVGPDGIVCERKKAVVLSVPLTAVTEVSYDAASHRVSSAVLAQLGPMASSGGACYPPQGCGAMVLGTLLVAAASTPFKYTNHFVRITWEEQGEEKRVEFKVDKHDYKSFLAELGSATGREWKDSAQEKRDVHQALKSNNGCQEPALTGSDLSFSAAKISATEAELNATAACGFRLVRFEIAASTGLTVKMQRSAAPPDVCQYLILHAIRASKMQKGLNRAGAQGFRLRQDLLMPNVRGILSLVMEKSPGPAKPHYEYLYSLTSRNSTLEKKAEQGREQGYELAGRADAGGVHILILEKVADAPAEPLTTIPELAGRPRGGFSR